jgi:competence ComEA-like helix-hairpin-helix protein
LHKKAADLTKNFQTAASTVLPIPCKKFFVCIILCSAAVAGGAACVKLPRRDAHEPAPNVRTTRPPLNAPPVNVNVATREELERLPGIGPALAARVVEHRERYGRFRRAEHLLLVRGISERRFRQLSPYVTAE